MSTFYEVAIVADVTNRPAAIRVTNKTGNSNYYLVFVNSVCSDAFATGKKELGGKYTQKTMRIKGPMRHEWERNELVAFRRGGSTVWIVSQR